MLFHHIYAVSIDDTVTFCNYVDKGTMLAIIDIQSAFHLLQVHPADRHLLAMNWRYNIYIDHCIPFDLRSAPKLFNILDDLFSWIAWNSGMSYLIHCLDDYLTMGPPLSSVCQCNLDIFTALCKDLRVPLAADKLEGPATSLSFLGIILDTNCMEIRLPEEKLARMQETLKIWLPMKKATKQQILSLVGTL